MEDLVLTVSAVNTQVKQLLEHIGTLTVTGEISTLSQPTSGHLYFTLKDNDAQIRCAFFRVYQKKVVPLKQGMQMLVKGKLSLYEPRGDYQLIVYDIEEAGMGALYQQFEALKKKLSVAGLFNTQHKKPLPPFPKTIGLITSPKSAAFRDLLITLYRRYPLAEFIVYPSEVQGNNASYQLIQAIEKACLDHQADVLILARGGGSIEDLWAFNDEQLAYAIFQASLPIVTGIGHETDFTIADFVADYRAATPTAAMVAVTPDYHDLIKQIDHYESRLFYLLKRHFTTPSQTIDHLAKTLSHVFLAQLHQKTKLYQTQYQRLMMNPLQQQLQAYHYQHTHLFTQLKQGFTLRLTTDKQSLALAIQTLQTLSPLETLTRGYAIVSQQGKTLVDSRYAQLDAPIDIRLAKGQLQAKIINHSQPIEAD